MAALAGETIIAGKVPGERIATNTVETSSGNVTTTETEVQAVTAPLVAGRTYKITWNTRIESTVAGDDATVRIREDNTAGAIKQSETFDLPVVNRVPRLVLEAEYTAVSTGDKTFSGTIIRAAGTGNITLNAASTVPSYLYVDYIRG